MNYKQWRLNIFIFQTVADGKNGIAILESGDCDAAVDAAVCSLKTASCLSPGSYLFVQDSLLEDVSWRLRERFAECRTGHLLNSMTDICDHVQFSVGKQVSDYLESTNLEVNQQFCRNYKKKNLV